MSEVSPRKRDVVTPVVVAAVAVLAVLFVALCCCGLVVVLGASWLTSQVEPTPVPTPAAADFVPASGVAQDLGRRLDTTPTTDTDYWLLHGQLVDGTGEPATRGAVQAPPDYKVGEIHTFWMGDEENQRYWQLDAELLIKTDHAYVYVSENTSYDIDDLRGAADLFEAQIYPVNRLHFGSEWLPGIDNDPRVTILVTDQMPLGIAGYFSSGDEYPAAMKARSNEREMFYVTSSYLRDLDDFGSLLSHEFQHMIHWNQDLSEALWINEGLSLIAEEVNGYPGVLGGTQFWRAPDIQLTNWSEERNDRLRNYAASKLFLSYLAERYGGYEILAELAADEDDGIDGVNDLLETKGQDAEFVSVFSDWVVANLLNDGSVEQGRYGYALRGGNRPRYETTLGEDDEFASWVSQFGADYLEIEARAGSRVTFEGSGVVRLAATDPHGGQYAWWSNRRNMLSSSLTRPVDLREVSNATLRFWTWYDIEEHFDYGYVAVSTDDGRTWETLPGTHTTSGDPNSANYGHGYTGKSGTWLEERVDMSAYGGEQVLLRFWYISDPGLNQSGWLVDDISIPEVGFADDAEGSGDGWVVDGFVRSSNEVPQSYVVQLVEYGTAVTVRRLSLDAENKAEIGLGDGIRRAVLIVSGVTTWTSEPAPYRVRVK